MLRVWGIEGEVRIVDSVKEKSVYVCVSSSINLFIFQDFLLTSDRTDTRTRARGTAKSFENLKITFYIVVGENRYTCRNGQKCVCTITHVRNAPGYAAVTRFHLRGLASTFPRFIRRVRNRQNFGESNLRSIVGHGRTNPLCRPSCSIIVLSFRDTELPFAVSTTYDEPNSSKLYRF